MNITTEMLLAAGCKIKWHACINGVVWKAFDRNGIPIAVKFDRYDQEPSQWEFRKLSVVKPRFRVKAKAMRTGLSAWDKVSEYFWPASEEPFSINQEKGTA